MKTAPAIWRFTSTSIACVTTVTIHSTLARVRTAVAPKPH
jgi:hypothetical protein